MAATRPGSGNGEVATVRSFTAYLAEQAAGMRFGDLPDDVVEIARQCVLDWLGVTLAGAGEPTTGILVDVLADGDGSGSGPGAVGGGAGAPLRRSGATLVGRRQRLPVTDAALVNGTASHALDYDDVNEAMLGHPSVPVLAAVLALGEFRGATGADLLVAFAAGYETECRLARALGTDHYRRGFHTTGTVGAFGSAAAGARLLGLGPEPTAVALGIAGTQAAGLKSMFGTMCKPLHAGRAAATGLLAARLAARGFTAHPGVVEAEQGFGVTHSSELDPDRGTADPPRGWYLRSNLFKYHAACFATHSAIEGLRRLRDGEHLTADDVTAVTIHADQLQMGMCAIPEPATGLECKFSLRHTAALVLAGIDTGATASYTGQNATDPVLVALRRRVRVVADRQGAGPTPVEVALTDGRVLHAAHDVSAPEADLGLQASRLVEKFSGLARPVLGDAGTARLGALVDRLVDLDDVGQLLSACVPA